MAIQEGEEENLSLRLKLPFEAL